MTADNGKVVVSAKIPGLGTVQGGRTLADIAGNVLQPFEKGSPVAYTAPAMGEPSAEDPPAAARKAKPKPKDKTAPRVKTTSDQDDEKKAKSLLALARNYVNSGLKAEAIKRLKTLIEKYPDAAVTEEAKKLLAELE